MDTATTFAGLTFSVTRANLTLFPNSGNPNFVFTASGTNPMSKTNSVTVK